jgi:hypothetical protein
MHATRILFLLSFFAVSAGPVRGQIELGAKAGLAVSNFVGDDDPEFSSKANFTGGFTFRHELSRNFSIQPEFLYAVKGAKTQTEIDGVLADVSFRVTYLEVPAILRYSITPRSGISPVLAAGPTLSWNADARVKFKAVGSDLEFTEADDSIESFDLGMAAEVGLDFKWDLRTISTGIRYTFGLSQLVSDSESNRRNGTLAITAGVAL